MRYSPKSSPTKDIGKTIQGLGVNLVEITKNKKVPAGGAANVVYNQLSELSQVGYKVADDFDLMMIAKGFESLNGLQTSAGTGSSQDDGSKVV